MAMAKTTGPLHPGSDFKLRRAKELQPGRQMIEMSGLSRREDRQSHHAHRFLAIGETVQTRPCRCN